MSRVLAKLRLIAHPDFPCAGVDDVSITARLDGGRLRLEYGVVGRIEALRIPPPTISQRADRLWEHSCFEAFFAAAPGYVELNLSPSTEWAAYRFAGYREGMRHLDMAAPVVSVDAGEACLALVATFDIPMAATRMGISAVIEAMDGGKSYWALAHPPGKPDFHDPDCFALDLSAWGRP